MTKKCKICGKQFEAKQKNYTICSSECREVNKKQLRKAHYTKNKEAMYQYNKTMRYKKAVGFPCKFCGKEVKPFIDNRMHRYHWHEKCLINKCIEAIKNGEPFGSGKSKILDFARNKGYTKAEIVEIMKKGGEI
jgi:predicted nucleic acid-binding Zn ribbon protein